MTRLFTDGAELRDLLFWTSTSGAVTVEASGQVIGSWCYKCDYDTGFVLKQFTALSEAYWRARHKFSTTTAQPNPFYFPKIRYGDTQVAAVMFNASNFPALYIGSTEVASASYVLSPSVWYLIEGHLKISDTAGVFELRLNGAPYISYYGDTQHLSYSQFDGIFFNGANGIVIGQNSQQYIDDIVLNSTSGSADNSWPRNGYVEALLPNADGDTLQWTSTSGSHFADVDDVPHNGDTDYLYTGITAVKRDMLHLFDLQNASIKRVQRVYTEARMRDENAAGAQVRLGIKHSGSVYVNTNPITLAGDYSRCIGEEYLSSPTSGSAWSAADIDSMQLVLETEY